MENVKRFEALKLSLKSDGKVLKGESGRFKSVEAFEKMCYTHRINIDRNNITQEYEACAAELYVPAPKKITYGDLQEMLDSETLFKDFELIVDGKGHPIIKYTNPETNQKFIFGTTHDVDYKFIYKALVAFGVPTLNTWKEVLFPHMEALKMGFLNGETAVETLWSRIYSGLEHLKRHYVDPDAMPVALEGKGSKADHIIPFHRKEVTLGDLHPFLRGFLERTEDHKYLCAMLASRLLGFRHAYIPYLIGAGGDGKSTFISFLDKVVDGYTATLDVADATYGLYNCIDKIFLFINDTSNKRIFYYETIKNISGNDFTRVNGKYQHARDVKLPGMILISSNQMPILTKAEWLKRRARIFKISPMTKDMKDNLVDVGTAVSLMASTTNEFLNYCLQCLDQVGNPETGEVRAPPTHKSIIDDGETPEEDEYEDFLQDLNLEVSAEVSITEYSFRKKIRNKIQEQHKSEYFMQNFLAYLREKKGITRGAGYYNGIGTALPKVDGNTKFIGKNAS
jgi:hypothetical protein